MPAYVSMLRGINVGGKTIKMERLRAAFEALSFFRVRTYAQSGNVVFETTQGSPAALPKKIQERILRDFGFPVPVILKTTEEMERVVAADPFAEEKSIEQSKLHVTFLSHALPRTAVTALEGLAAGKERFCILNQEVYLYCPNGYGRTKLSNTNIEKKLSVVATTRNWKTVKALLEMTQS